MKYILHFFSLPISSIDTIPENRYIQYSPLKEILIHYLTERAGYVIFSTEVSTVISTELLEILTAVSCFCLWFNYNYGQH
jgi:hypothetical protein